MKKVLFVCKNNVFRSRIAEYFFKKINKNKKYKAESAGIFKWNKKDLKKDKGYHALKKVIKKLGIKLPMNSKGINSSLLKKTDILVIVADDVPSFLFKDKKAFNGKIIVWKTKDVEEGDKHYEKRGTMYRSIKFIERKVREFVKKLK